MNGNYSYGGFILLLIILCLICIPGLAAPVLSIVKETPDKIIVLDLKDRQVSVSQPVQSIVILDNHQQMTHALVALGEYNKIIGVDQETAKEKILFPNIGDKTLVGASNEPDIEMIVGLKPDLVLAGDADDALIKKLENAGLTVVTMSLWPTPAEGFAPTTENAKILGTLVGAKEKAKEYSVWVGGYLNKIDEKVKTLSVDNHPKTLLIYKWDVAKLSSIGKDNRFSFVLNYVGANNLADKVTGNWAEIDPEFAITENPDYIIYDETDYNASGYGNTDPTTIANNIEKLKNIPGFNNINAVKNNHVYGIPKSLLSGNTWLGTIYVAPLIHPELFGDLDPDAIHQEYLKKFLGIDFNVKKDGIFVYPDQ
jgi:iron complex transport system substrate-binding protein